jgi:hypothetical protein
MTSESDPPVLPNQEGNSISSRTPEGSPSLDLKKNLDRELTNISETIHTLIDVLQMKASELSLLDPASPDAQAARNLSFTLTCDHPMLFRFVLSESYRILIENIITNYAPKHTDGLYQTAEVSTAEYFNHELDHYNVANSYVEGSKLQIVYGFVQLNFTDFTDENRTAIVPWILYPQVYAPEEITHDPSHFIDYLLAPEKPSHGSPQKDVEMALEVARRNNIDITKILKEKGFGPDGLPLKKD